MPTTEFVETSAAPVHAASTGGGSNWVALGGSLVGTGAGTGSGIGFAWAAWGQDPTLQSVGIAFASAFAGTIASTALSKGYQAATEKNTAGRAAGRAAGESARRADHAQWLARESARTEAYGGLLAASRTQGWLAENTTIPFVTAVDMPPATSAPQSDEPFCTKVPGLPDEVANRSVIVGGPGRLYQSPLAYQFPR